MLEPVIAKADLEKWADYLLNHSMGGISSEDRVMIKGERICWPLMAVLESKVIQAGGIPDVYLVPPNNERGRVWSSELGRYGKKEQLEAAPAWHADRYNSMTKYIEVLGAESPSAYAGLTAEQVKGLAQADTPFATTRLSKPWVITLYPTPGFARTEGMPLEDYVNFIVSASTADPAELKEAEERVAPLFDESERVKIITQHPSGRELTLEMSIKQSKAELCYGLRNFPDGEVYTSPDANSPEGEIFVDLPVHYGGIDIEGIYLRIVGGVIKEYSADRGHSQLEAIIETDPGSKRIGEIALGMNPGMDKVLKHPLFVEKVGGTLHIAIGASYDNVYVDDPGSKEGQEILGKLVDAGIVNRSAQHVDIVVDFRPGGAGKAVFFDNTEVVVRDGLWLKK